MPHDEFEEDVLTKEKQKVQKPGMYKVLLHNDDYTTMEFVILVLQKFFYKNEAESTHIMLSVHNKGVGVAGVFTKEVAETKMVQVNDFSKQNQHPLKCTIEPE